MKNTKDSPRSSQALIDKLQALVAEAETVMGGAVSEHSADALSNIRDRFNVARDHLGEFYDTAKDRVVAGAKSTDTVIRTNPYQSIAIAAGVGLLVGVLLGRRRA